MPSPERVIEKKGTPVPETEAKNRALDALHVRLILGNAALNPSEKLSNIQENKLGKINYAPFIYASHQERSEFWSRDKNNFEIQKELWIENTASSLQQLSQSTQKERWEAFFQKFHIDLDGDARKAAEALYSRYFGNDARARIETFVRDAINAYKTDVSLLNQEADKIRWLGNIFGKRSAEITSHLIYAQLKSEAPALKHALIESVNQGKNGVLGANALSLNEHALLQWLWNSIKENSAQKNKLPQQETKKTIEEKNKSHQWRREKAGNPRLFPEEELAKNISDPYKIARGLKQQAPQKYQSTSEEQLAQEIAKEQRLLSEMLGKMGLDTARLEKKKMEVLQNYEQFIQKKYGIKPPHIASITILPVSGITKEYYRPHVNAYAYVRPSYPVIFLNMDAIIDHAAKLGLTQGRHWETMPAKEFGTFIERLLDEINPHEYTHLIGDMSFWRLYNNGQKTDTWYPEKVGLKLTKPIRTKPQENNEQFAFQERGRGLMEAVTVELTNKWAKNMHAKLDIDSYSAERKVLLSLTDLLARNQRISQDEAFGKFVRAYFSSKGFRLLAQELSEKKKDAKGNVLYLRPHFLTIIYGLMEYEKEKASEQNATSYPLTLAFIENRLNPLQKTELLDNMAEIEISPKAKSWFETQLSKHQERRRAA